MYGMATLELEPPSKNLTIPSTALIEQTGEGKGSVYVVQDGKVFRQPVQVGEDNGREVEILSGLTSESQVVVSYSGSIAVGLAVNAVRWGGGDRERRAQQVRGARKLVAKGRWTSRRSTITSPAISRRRSDVAECHEATGDAGPWRSSGPSRPRSTRPAPP